MDLVDKAQYRITQFISLLLVVAIGVSIWNGQWFQVYLGSLAFLMTYIPAIISKNIKLTLPSEFEFLAVVFVFLSIYLGEIHQYYIHYWWWDILLHGLSGVLLGIVGFVMVYLFSTDKHFQVRLSPKFVGIFTFTFSIALGVLWEIIEYSIDQTLGFNMQKSGLDDTMGDLILNSLGALIASAWGYLYTLKAKDPLIDRLIQKLIKKNPKIFGSSSGNK